MPLIPAPLVYRDGVPWSERYGDVYHTRAGASAQCRAVFLAGNELPQRWTSCDRFQILETGFGLGLNFLTTWQAWRASAAAEARLQFISIEQAPLTQEDLRQALAHHPDLAETAQELVHAWPALTPGFHTLAFDGGRVTLLLALGDLADLLPQLTLAVDAVFLDGFSPRCNPEAWSDPVMRQIARHCRHGATLASWCVAGEVRRALERHGFRTWRATGFGGKRQRLEARFDKIPEATWQNIVRRAPQPVLQARLQPRNERRALVVGAGLAGALVSAALTARGWHVDLFDAQDGPAQRASGNPAGILRPYPSLDDNFSARLTRAGYFLGWQQLALLDGLVPCARHGVLHLANNAAEALHLQDMIARLAHPPTSMRWCCQAEAERLGQCLAPWGALFFPEAGWVAPDSWCRQALATAPDTLLHCHWRSMVELVADDRGWRAVDPSARTLGRAPVAILAGGSAALPLAAAPNWPRQGWRGQLTQLNPDGQPSAGPVLCRQGYAIRGAPQGPCVGATYTPETSLELRAEDRHKNLERWERFTGIRDACVHGERVGVRSISRDRLPIIGPVPGHPGLFALTALGSRGLAWAPLGAQLITAWLEGDPLPLERDLIQAIAPSRYDGS